MRTDAHDRFRSCIGEALQVPPDRVALFGRGRVAWYAILRAVGLGPGDEVIVPAFTCVAVPNAILYAGARPVWVDIDASYTLDPAAVEAAVSPRTKVILAQNTFGLSSDLDALAPIAERHGLTLVDDCTHGLGGRYRGRPNGAGAAFSFFSTQWSKPISTGLGGFAVARDPEAAAMLRDLEAAAAEPSAIRGMALRALAFGRELAGDGRMLRAGRAAYRTLGRAGVLPGSSSRDELEGAAMPDGFMVRLSSAQARLGAARIARLPADVERRREIAHRYSGWLDARGRTPAPEPAGVDHAFLRYPIRVRDRRRMLGAAGRAGLDLGDWFVSPIHPVTERLERWDYRAGTAPRAEEACREIVNLPTGPALRGRDVDRVLRLLEETLELIR